MNRSPEEIQPAIDLLQAVQVSKFRWAYYATEVRSWWVVSSGDLWALTELIRSGKYDPYTAWCIQEHGRELNQDQKRRYGLCRKVSQGPNGLLYENSSNYLQEIKQEISTSLSTYPCFSCYPLAGPTPTSSGFQATRV